MELSAYSLTPLCEDEEFILYRGHAKQIDQPSILLLAPVSARPAPTTLKKIDREYSLRSELDAIWAVRPLVISRYNDKPVLVLKDPGGELLGRGIQKPMEVREFLRLGIGLAAAVGHLHQQALIHKDLKPDNIFFDAATGQVWLTGFGIASPLASERPLPELPESIAGTLAYMAPEQTGRVNRSIDSRSDLYSLGITLYEMLTGELPFIASDPMEWVHCHIARLPVSPSARMAGIPNPIAEIVMRLIAKTAEDRYQTAAGVEIDLRHCLVEWEIRQWIDEFALGKHDTPARLLIPEKLYGRSHEVETLLASFDRVVTSGAPELVLVSGYSGVGKSSVVLELHKVAVPPRGIFASGKFDQYKRDIPYHTLAQAFRGLVRSLLSRTEAELCIWRKDLLEALGPNARLIVDVVPELELIIGEPPAVSEVPPQDAKRRFQLAFRRFIRVFARPEHPLVLFLDDLQWLDAATLDLIEDLLTQSDVRDLMVIGAYRNNEVDSSHPLMRMLDIIRDGDTSVEEILLGPLTPVQLAQFIGDCLHCEPECATPLSILIHEKTAGNPFFVIHFISELVEDDLLTFDYSQGQWSWDLKNIRAKRYTENVVDFMVAKLNRLPVETQKALQLVACIGESADFFLLEMASQDDCQQIHQWLSAAAQADLIVRTDNSYRFLHDRVHEAVYSMFPEELRLEAHVRIGRLLAENLAPEGREERIFEIVNQFNRSSTLIRSNGERRTIAELNLVAAKRAKGSTAYASALSYLAAGRKLLTDENWNSDYELVFSLECLTAECELLTADLGSAEKRLETLAGRASRTHDLAIVTRLRLTLYTVLDQLDRGIEICLEYLGRGGIKWSAHPTDEEVQHEYDRIWSLLGEHPIEDLLDVPPISRSDILDVLEVLAEIITPAVFFDKNLCALVIFRVINLSVEHGISEASCFACVWFGIIAGPRFGNYRDAFRFGQLGYDLLQRCGSTRYEARICLCFAVVAPWTKHARHSRDLVRHSFDVAYRMGDLTYAAYSFTQLVTNFLVAGDQLADAELEAEKGLAFATAAGLGLVVDIVGADLQLIRTLRGLTERFGSFSEKGFDETTFEQHLASNPALADPGFGYWTLKAEARFFAGDYASAVNASLQAQQLLWAAPALLEQAAFRFYGALSHAAVWDSASMDEKQMHFEALTAHEKQLELWAEHCPANFEDRVALVSAEVARLENRLLDAETLYEKAICSARENGFIHNEALGYELAARFYEARGFDTIANAYRREARYRYSSWGADGKVNQLDELYPEIKDERPAFRTANTIVVPSDRLDLATVVKVSQAASGEVVFEKLIEKIMRAAIEHAGAERGLLIFTRRDELQVEAEAAATTDDITVRHRDVSSAAFPESVVRFVARTREDVILNDSTAPNQFSTDSYIVQRRPRSVACLPLVNQAKLSAVIYLENNLSTHAFNSDRITVLKVLASQAAISLENSRLYRDLENREAKIRRLVDSDILAILIWNAEGAIIESNEAFLRMSQFDRNDIVAGRVRWTDLTPAEWRSADERALATVLQTGRVGPYEKELFRKDGSRVNVLVAGTLFEEGGREGVAFALDLTEQKRVEEALRRSESYLEQAQRLTHIGSWAWQLPDRDALHMSEEWYSIYEFDPKEGMPTWEQRLERIHPEDRALWHAEIERAIADKSDYDMEVRILTPRSTIKHIHSIGHPVLDSSGELLEFVGVAMDVTERKNAEEALRSSEAYLADAQGLTHTGSCAIDGASGETVYWSDEMFRIFDFDPRHGVPTLEQWLQCIHADDRNQVRLASEQTFLNKVNCDIEFRILQPDGTVKHIHGIGHPVLSETGRLLQVVGTMVDITERKRAEETRNRLHQLEADLAHINRVSIMGELTASLAHEIRQPMFAASTDATTCMQWLSKDQPNVGAASEAASRVIKDINRASDIIGRIKTLFKQGTTQREVVDVNEVVHEIIMLLRSEADRHKVSMRANLTGDLPKVMADGVQLQQVFMNLMLNSIEAMKEKGGALTVESKINEEGKLLISIHDTGVGLPTDKVDQIFSAFFTTKPQGTGMGLAITRSIVESHGGRVWASANSQRGASFHFTLPTATEHQDTPATET